MAASLAKLFSDGRSDRGNVMPVTTPVTMKVTAENAIGRMAVGHPGWTPGRGKPCPAWFAGRSPTCFQALRPDPHPAGAGRSPLRGGPLLLRLLALVSVGHLAALSGFHPRAGRPTWNQGAPASLGPGVGRGAAPHSTTGPWAALVSLGRYLVGGSP